MRFNLPPMCHGRSRLLQTSTAGSGRIRRAQPPLGNRRRSSLERWGACRSNREDHQSEERLVLHPNNNNSAAYENAARSARHPSSSAVCLSAARTNLRRGRSVDCIIAATQAWRLENSADHENAVRSARRLSSSVACATVVLVVLRSSSSVKSDRHRRALRHANAER